MSVGGTVSRHICVSLWCQCIQFKLTGFVYQWMTCQEPVYLAEDRFLISNCPHVGTVSDAAGVLRCQSGRYAADVPAWPMY